jgi:hypothetical protein
METVRMTALATTAAQALGTTREAAFDAIVSVARELEIRGHVLTVKEADEIMLILQRSAALPTITRTPADRA